MFSWDPTSSVVLFYYIKFSKYYTSCLQLKPTGHIEYFTVIILFIFYFNNNSVSVANLYDKYCKTEDIMSVLCAPPGWSSG